MKRTNARFTTILCLAAAGVLAIIVNISPVQAALIIHYDGINTAYSGGDRIYWNTSTPKFTLPSSVDTKIDGDEEVENDDVYIRTWKYSDTTPISPASGYTGPEIYAALQNTSSTQAFSNMNGNSGIRSGSLTYNDDLAAGFALVGSTSSILNTMVFFKTGIDDVSFDSSSSISLTGNTSSIPSESDMRFVVQSGGQWYISNTISYTTISVPIAGKNWTLSSLDTYNFAAFSPENAAPLPSAPNSGFIYQGSDFENISAVGLYFTLTKTDNLPYLSLWDFSVNAIPEPSTYALLLIGSMTLLCFRRRRATK